MTGAAVERVEARPQADCASCGASVPVPAAGGVVRCEHCEASLWVEITGTFRHFVFKPSVRPGEVASHVNRWLFEAGSAESVKVSRTTLRYYPFWRVERGARVDLVAAESGPSGPLVEISRPSGQLVPFAPEMEDGAIFLAAAREPPAACGDGSLSGDDSCDIWLVHVPVYHAICERPGHEDLILVEATGGQVVGANAPAGTLAVGARRAGIVLWAGAAALVAIGALVPWSWAALLGWGIVGAGVWVLVLRGISGGRQ